MAAAPEYLHATGGAQQELVLLHGWGGNRETWRGVVAGLRRWANITLIDLPGVAPGAADAPPSLEDCLAQILAAAPPRALYVGFSVGGQLAVALAAHAPRRVLGVVTVGYNPCFLAEADWPGMPREDFAQFLDGFEAAPAKTLARFDALQTLGVPRQRALLRDAAGRRCSSPDTSLRSGLEWLATLDQRPVLQRLPQPRLHLFAASDALVPAAVAAAVGGLAGEQGASAVKVMDASGHLAPLEAGAGLADTIEGYAAQHALLDAPAAAADEIPKAAVAASFSRAAERYDSVAHLQRDVGEALLARLPAAAETVLDLGCGTGYFSRPLAGRFKGARLLGLDLAEGMVRYAREREQGAGEWLVADAEALPLASASINVVYSSLTLQWCYRLPLLFTELHRILAPGGKCVFTTLGPGTLHELRDAWAEVDAHQHVNTFLPAEALRSAAADLPGVTLHLETRTYRLTYPRVRDLLDELKALGAHNMNPQRPAGLTSRRAMQGMLRAYEKRRVDGSLPATYEVYFAELEKA